MNTPIPSPTSRPLPRPLTGAEPLGEIGEVAVAEALRLGAHAFISKDDLTHLVPAVERELEGVAARRKRRDAEGARRRDPAYLAAVLDEAGAAILACDDAGAVEFWNAAAERLFDGLAGDAGRRTAGDLLDRSPASLIGQGRQRAVGYRTDGATFTLEVAAREAQVEGRRVIVLTIV
ncbi:MAG: hypothetical protein EXR72_06815 [Myxococcales bacterium]|nr:hypothetical protein [Myxococcales bacterium]